MGATPDVLWWEWEPNSWEVCPGEQELVRRNFARCPVGQVGKMGGNTFIQTCSMMLARLVSTEWKLNALAFQTAGCEAIAV